MAGWVLIILMGVSNPVLIQVDQIEHIQFRSKEACEDAANHIMSYAADNIAKLEPEYSSYAAMPVAKCFPTR